MYSIGMSDMCWSLNGLRKQVPTNYVHIAKTNNLAPPFWNPQNFIENTTSTMKEIEEPHLCTATFLESL